MDKTEGIVDQEEDGEVPSKEANEQTIQVGMIELTGEAEIPGKQGRGRRRGRQQWTSAYFAVRFSEEPEPLASGAIFMRKNPGGGFCAAQGSKGTK